MADDKHPTTPDQERTLLADLCNEAVALYGPDWEAIQRHVSDRLSGMDALERTYLMEKVERILEFSALDRSQNGMH
ncbi:hypothetical protein [Methylosinus sp. LW4]|uniref:hypothetical protein n=1 Tax=Methylosinus sp. LW4 TaxID=136993 RepID=UPI0003704681|nr:hypothetical protein [Methylosinus sp. LW4]